MAVSRLDASSSAADMLAELQTRRISATELLEFHLNRIRRHNARLNAVILVDEVGAREHALDADRGLAGDEPAQLSGLPITVKDAIDISGLPTTCGLRRRQDHRAVCDATVVRNARRAGAVILGKTNTPPYAGDWQTDNTLFGRTNNPWNLSRTPGGSTGGGAAAVAAGLSPLEIGSDIGGSIRVPAAFCGVYGHRPSETLIPLSGHFPGSSLPNVGSVLNVIGPLARSATDLELALDALAGPDVGEDVAWRVQLPEARRERLQEFRVAVLPPLGWVPVDGEIEGALDRVVTALRGAGVRVQQIGPESFGDFREAHLLYQTLLVAMFSFNVGGTDEELLKHADDSIMGDEELMRPAHRLLGSAHVLLQAYAQRERYREAYRAFFRDWDVLLTPVTLIPAFPHQADAIETLQIEGNTVPYHRLNVYPGIATLCGQPATAFPAGSTRSGLPIGLQAIGPYLEDRTPIRFAELLAHEIGGFEPPSGYE